MKKTVFLAKCLLVCLMMGLTVFSALADISSLSSRLVLVSIELQLDEEESEGWQPGITYQNIAIQASALYKRNLELGGIIISDKGDIVIPDFRFDQKYISSIKVRDSEGNEYTAEPYGFYKSFPAQVIRVNDFKSEIPPLVFSEEKISLGSELYIITLVEMLRGWTGVIRPLVAYGYDFNNKNDIHIYTGSLQNLNHPEMEMAINPLVLMPQISIVSNAKGNPLGIITENWFNAENMQKFWSAAVLNNDDLILFSDLEKRKEEIQDEYEKSVFKVNIKLRYDDASDEDSMEIMYYYAMRTGRRPSPGEMNELTYYGILIDDNKIFIPEAVINSVVKRIDKITVEHKGMEYSAAFDGAFKNFLGFIVKVDEKTDAVPVKVAAEKPSLYESYIYIRIKEIFGDKKVESDYMRLVGEKRIYKNERTAETMRPLESGSLVINIKDGLLVGFQADVKRDDEEKENLAGGDAARMMDGLMRQAVQKLYFPEEIKMLISSPDDYYDPVLIPLSKEQAKELVWLGIEYSPMTPILASSLNVEQVTLSGEIGLLVSRVYKGSPASRIGIKEGDILLSIQEPFDDRPVRLISSWERSADQFDFSFKDGSSMHYYSSDNIKPFRDRRNYLTKLFTLIGAGKSVEIKYVSDGEEKTKTIVTEKAPPDFDSVDKYKNSDIGLTVKDISYEVKAALFLSDDIKGVVVSEIKPGSPSAVARMSIFEIILKIDDRFITDVESFKTVIEELVGGGREKAKVFMMNGLGETRVVDLNLKQIKKGE